MRITVDLPEEIVAAMWADQTWHGKQVKSLPEVLTDVAEEYAAKYRNAFPKAMPATLERFREAHPDIDPLPCDSCQFFRPVGATGKGVTDTRCLCAHRHLLAFKHPITGDPDSEIWGYYRHGGCTDFVEDQ